MGTEAEFGRKFRGLQVAADEVPDYIERVLRGYLDRREGGEPFAAYVSRADEAWLL
jgi:sulfite reductase (ferredoxin)